MDKDLFDNLARAMAKGASRRDVLRGMLGGVAAGAATAVLPKAAGVAAQNTCAGSGEACEMVAGSCCAPYTCFEAICDVPRGCVGEGLPCADDFPCCADEGLSCVAGICAAACPGLGEACEMVEGACCPPYTCFEAKCDIPRGCVGAGLPCVDEFPCCADDGLSCIEGVCAVAIVDDDEGVVVSAMPVTGTGGANTGNGWLGAVAAGGAVAAAGSLLRRNRAESGDRAVS